MAQLSVELVPGEQAEALEAQGRVCEGSGRGACRSLPVPVVP